MRSFVLVVLAACGAPASPPATSAPPSSSSSSAPVASAPAPAAPVSTAKKRTRTAKPNVVPHDGTKPKNGRPLNPKDPMGRTVFVREDDHCFVEIPDSTEVVDCPPETDDPAYDNCDAQLVLDGNGDKCFCVSGRGNPRPMPRPIPCPAK